MNEAVDEVGVVFELGDELVLVAERVEAHRVDLVPIRLDERLHVDVFEYALEDGELVLFGELVALQEPLEAR